MESHITALEMRKKFGSVLDRVVEKKEHITIMRGNEPLAVLIPVEDHERQCSHPGRIKKNEEVLEKLEAWKRKNRKLMKRVSKGDSALLIRKMRDSRWSSSTRPSR